jgi:2,4-dienoyl-CoA reductase-like NADH-dependent reductase (Old Yellow Enzyme family)
MSIPAAFLRPGRIGRLELENRLVRAATSETMATADGKAAGRLADFYATLAKGGAGLLITGHIYVERRGQCSPNQIGLYANDMIAGLRLVTEAVHANGGRIFAELSHAGSQTAMPHITPVSPSIVTNEIFERAAKEMTEQDIADVIAAFAAAARRAVAAGFDGIHLHGGNGYLIAQFSSPHTNRRTDAWGGDAKRRDRFFLDVYRAVREAVGPDVPVTARIGIADSVPNGLTEAEGIARAALLAQHGIDALEVSYCVMSTYLENIRPYVALDAWRAAKDWVLPRLWTPAAKEAYYRPFARAVKQATGIPVILVGGIRDTATMQDIIASGDADFLSFARPFVREPDFPNTLKAGRTGRVDCVSCNICLMHDGFDPLQCWRKRAADLAYHAYCRFWRDRGAY